MPLANSTLLHGKSPEETRNKSKIPQQIKALCNKPMASIILTREKLRPFPPKSGMRQRCPLSPM
jgi:hypothetical protein